MNSMLIAQALAVLLFMCLEGAAGSLKSPVQSRYPPLLLTSFNSRRPLSLAGALLSSFFPSGTYPELALIFSETLATAYLSRSGFAFA